MRPYLALIHDSFREALATRVLWIVLILISVFLVLIAPFGFEKTVAVSIRWNDVSDKSGFIHRIIEEKENVRRPGERVWKGLSKKTRKELSELAPDADRSEKIRAFARVREDVNRLLHTREFYSEKIWEGIRLGAEGSELKQRGLTALNDEEQYRLNRLAIEAAYPDFIRAGSPTAIQLRYLWYPLGEEIAASEQDVHRFLQIIIAFSVTALVGYVGVFIALLVTASIIPQMLDAGAIDLLLSKPVSRSLLFLSKFLGGCMFILLNTAFLIVGLWLVLGFRFNLWSSGLLWTIPVFVFIFAIYFSVSALAAAIWRNAVVSIVVSILFFAVCLATGLIKNGLDENFLDARRTSAIVPTANSLIIARRDGGGFEWNDEEQSWLQVFRGTQRRGPGRRQSMIGPVYDGKNARLMMIRSAAGMRWIPGAPKLAVALRANDWKPKDSINVPSGTKVLAIGKDGEALAVGTSGVFQLRGDPQAEGGVEVFGMKLPGFGQEARFERADDEKLDWREPFSASVDQTNRSVVVRSGDKAAVLARDQEGRFKVAASIEWSNPDQSLIGRAGSRVAMASQDGSIKVLDSKTLKTIREYSPFGRNEPKSIQSSPDGRWIAILFHHRRLWLYDTQADLPGIKLPPGQGDITSVAFGPDNSLYVSSGFARVVKYVDAETMTESGRFMQEPDFAESMYEWVFDPLYSVFPKPTKMSSVVAWLMTNQETIAAEGGGDLTSERVVLDIWEPIWSNLAFLAVMLTVTCIYVTRKDF